MTSDEQPFSDLEASGPGQLVTGADSGGEHDEIGVQVVLPRREAHAPHSAVLAHQDLAAGRAGVDHHAELLDVAA